MPAIDAKGLSNHAEQILTTVAQDMQTYQSERKQITKSHGHGSVTEEDAPSQIHAMTTIRGRILHGSDGFRI